MTTKNVWVFYQDGGTPTQGWGDRHFFLANYYDREKYKTTIFSANDCHMFSERVDFPGHFWLTQYGAVQYCWVKINSYSRGSSKRRVLSWLLFALKLFFLPKKQLGKPDIIIVSSMPMFPVLPALFYKWIYGTKVIFEVRDIWPLTIIDMEKYSNANPFVAILRIVEKLAYRKSDHLVSVLDKADKHFQGSVKRPAKFTWISNGIDPEILRPTADGTHPILKNIPKDKFIVGYAGKMSISNALEFVIAAAKLLSHVDDVHFVLIGEGDCRENLIDQSKDLKNVTFLPRVKKHLVHQIILTFDVAIISFRKLRIYQYGISTNKLFDYMMAELPIIMASEHLHDAYHKSGAIFHTDAENPTAIAETIMNASRMSQSELRALGIKGRKLAQNHYLYQHLSRRYQKVFQELV